jgi:hypothetical protein
MGRSDYFKKGDFNRICERCGFKMKASETRKEWTGQIVCADGCWEARHPQEFVRGRRDRQRVPLPRPDSEPVYLEPTDVTADDL